MRVKKQKKYLVGLEFGGTNIKAALFDNKPKIIHKEFQPTHAKRGVESVLKRVKKTIHNLINKEKILSNHLMGIGIASPGPLDTKKGIVFNSPNLPGWEKVPLKRVIEREFNVPVILENDTNAIALGEYWMGSGKGVNHLICLTLGTGVGGGIILNGQILHGRDDLGGEIGHMIIEKDGLECNCGNRGCLEAFVSATGIVKRTIQALNKGRESSLLKKRNRLTSELIFNEAKKGDRLSLEIVNETAEYLGIGLANLVNILNPEIIILGGGVSHSGEILFKPTLKELKKRAFHRGVEHLKVLPPKLGNSAGILGSIYPFFHKT